MIRQLAITYPADFLGDEDSQRLLEIMRAIVTHLNAKEIAFVLDVQHSQLSDALHGRERKVWHDRWTRVIKRMLAERAQHGDETAADLQRQLIELDLAGSAFVAVEAEPATPEEENAILRRELAKFGDAGRAALDRVKKRSRR